MNPRNIIFHHIKHNSGSQQQAEIVIYKEVNSLPVQLLSHFHMESYPEEDQVGHKTLLPILYNYHSLLNNTENFCGHSGSNTT